MKSAITFLPQKRSVPLQDGRTLLEIALGGNVPIDHSCGGMGSCGTCRVFVDSSESPLPPRNELESMMAKDRDFAENERLACQLKPCGAMVVTVPRDR